MKKKLISWVSLILTFIFLLSLVSAEGTADLKSSGRLAIFYLPATGNSAMMDSATLTASAIVSRWPNMELVISRISDKRQPKSYNSIEKAINNGVFGEGKLTGQGELRLDSKEFTASYCEEIWFIIPGSASVNILQNDSLKSYLASVIGSYPVHIHFAVIGRSFTNEQIASFPLLSDEFADLVCLKEDFLAQTQERQSGIYNGDFFFASLFGKPFHLTMTIQQDQKLSFELPVNSAVLILARSDKDPILSLENQDEEPVEANPLVFQKRKGETHSYAGIYSANELKAGSYYVSVSEDSPELSIKGYFFPTSEISIDLMIPEHFYRGQNTVKMSIAEPFNKLQGYDNQLKVEWGENQSSETLPFDLGEKEGEWQIDLKIPENVQTLTLTPSCKLWMADGNLVWSWQGESRTVEVQNQGISVKTDRPTNLDLYYKVGNVPSYHADWSNFFSYNILDKPELKVLFSDETPDEIKDVWQIDFDPEKTEEGFTLKLKGKNTTDTESDNQLQDFTIKICCGDVETSLSIHLINAENQLINAILFTPEIIQDVAVGDKVKIESSISINETEWENARKELPDLPELSDLQFKVTLFESDKEEKETDISDQSSFIRNTESNEEKQTATVELEIPKDWEGGVRYLKYRIQDEQENTWKSVDPIQVTIKNEKPQWKGDQFSSKNITIDGTPGQYKEINIVSEVFGTDDMISLFEDPETTTPESVTLKISSASINEERKYPSEDASQITVNEPGEYKLTVTASDGVNESEPVEITVHVNSSFTRMILFAGGGLLLILIALTVILIIRQKRKPAFDDIRIKTVITNDSDAEHREELLNKSKSIAMRRYQKQSVSLNTILILSHQPEISPKVTEVLKDISVEPYRYGEIRIVFGKKAAIAVGRQSNQERVAQGNVFRFRIENSYVQIENSQDE